LSFAAQDEKNMYGKFFFLIPYISDRRVM